MNRRQQVKAAEWRLAKDAGQAWERAYPEIQRTLERLRTDGPRATDSPERVGKFLLREIRRSRDMESVGADPSRVGLERRFGPTLDYEYIPPPEAQAVSRNVGRLVEVASSGAVAAFATGFMVSPRLLMTNWHVFEDASWARDVSVQFGYEYVGVTLQAGATFRLRPEEYFIADKERDYAIVAVEPTNGDGITLRSRGFSRMIPGEGKILLGHGVNIIGHPGGMPKTYVFRNNPLVQVNPSTLFYLSDSDEGASGSPAYNPVWELIALHHRAVPRMQNGRVLLLNGSYWEEGMPTEDIDWLANEGVRISVIVRHLQSVYDRAPHQLLQELLAESVDPVGHEASRTTGGTSMSEVLPSPTPMSTGPVSPAAVPVQMTFNGPVTIQIGAQVSQPSAIASAAPAPDVSVGAEAVIRFDPDYDNRPGYDESFLGITVPRPRTSASRLSEMLKDGSSELVLPYHNYSLAMNKTRRLQMWSAANVDYSPAARRWFGGRESFGSDKWIPDPRIPAKYQIMDAEAYSPSRSLQRGHMVRREDAAWGRSRKTQEYGNSDTFHWTNCTPQHGGFNQSSHNPGPGEPTYRGLWGGLENKITTVAEHADESKLVIFSGPVLSSEDDEYDWGYGYIAIPMKFWKVVIAREAGTLRAYGFVLDQTRAFRDLGFERLRFGKFEDYAKPVAEIAALAGVEFDAVVLAADANAAPA
jgi:endonuclease G, mitochondrial